MSKTGPKPKNLLGLRFYKWLVISDTKKRGPRKEIQWECKCDCGTIRLVMSRSLLGKRSKSCGCINSQLTHGKHNTKEYHSWRSMKKRCYLKTHPAYNHYGGRGIAVQKSWINSFKRFFKDMGLAPDKGSSLDRIDNNKGYSAKNCRWATKEQQGNNKRNNIVIEGVSLHKYCRDNNLNFSRIHKRINKGWNLQQAIKTPKLYGGISGKDCAKYRDVASVASVRIRR